MNIYVARQVALKEQMLWKGYKGDEKKSNSILTNERKANYFGNAVQ